MNKTIAVRIPIIFCVILTLLAALWAALLRVGWQTAAAARAARRTARCVDDLRLSGDAGQS